VLATTPCIINERGATDVGMLEGGRRRCCVVCASYDIVYCHQSARCRRGGCCAVCASYNTAYCYQSARRSKRQDACCTIYPVLYHELARRSRRGNAVPSTTLCSFINERGVAGKEMLCRLQHRAVSSISETREGGGTVLPTTLCIQSVSEA
jgi:hypothetical protein